MVGGPSRVNPPVDSADGQQAEPRLYGRTGWAPRTPRLVQADAGVPLVQGTAGGREDTPGIGHTVEDPDELRAARTEEGNPVAGSDEGNRCRQAPRGVAAAAGLAELRLLVTIGADWPQARSGSMTVLPPAVRISR